MLIYSFYTERRLLLIIPWIRVSTAMGCNADAKIMRSERWDHIVPSLCSQESRIERDTERKKRRQTDRQTQTDGRTYDGCEVYLARRGVFSLSLSLSLNYFSAGCWFVHFAVALLSQSAILMCC